MPSKQVAVGSNPTRDTIFVSRYGEIGRRTRLKILYPKGCEGSIPSTDTIFKGVINERKRIYIN